MLRKHDIKRIGKRREDLVEIVRGWTVDVVIDVFAPWDGVYALGGTACTALIRTTLGNHLARVCSSGCYMELVRLWSE